MRRERQVCPGHPESELAHAGATLYSHGSHGTAAASAASGDPRISDDHRSPSCLLVTSVRRVTRRANPAARSALCELTSMIRQLSSHQTNKTAECAVSVTESAMDRASAPSSCPARLPTVSPTNSPAILTCSERQQNFSRALVSRGSSSSGTCQSCALQPPGRQFQSLCLPTTY